MKDILAIVAVLVLFCGCAKNEKDALLIDAVRNGKHVVRHERVAVQDLGRRLKAAGFDSNSMVRIYSAGVPKDVSSCSNDTIWLNGGTNISHARIRLVMDTVVDSGIGLWGPKCEGCMEKLPEGVDEMKRGKTGESKEAGND